MTSILLTKALVTIACSEFSKKTFLTTIANTTSLVTILLQKRAKHTPLQSISLEKFQFRLKLLESIVSDWEDHGSRIHGTADQKQTAEIQQHSDEEDSLLSSSSLPKPLCIMLENFHSLFDNVHFHIRMIESKVRSFDERRSSDRWWNAYGRVDKWWAPLDYSVHIAELGKLSAELDDQFKLLVEVIQCMPK